MIIKFLLSGVRFLKAKISKAAWKIKKLFLRARGIYYVNGPEVLPAPLSREDEAEIIDRLECDERARQILIEHNLRLVVYIAKRFENTGVGIEDLVSIGTIGLVKAINTFRADKNIKLATYASRCIENEILMYIRKTSGNKAEVSIDEPLNVDWDGNELLLSDVLGSDDDSVIFEIEQLEERAAIRRAVASLGEREREIIELRYGMRGENELTQKEVADRLGISQSYISRLEKKIISKLRVELEVGKK
ncbi:MAG: RNA polymerase sporulation sigma factor SigE [Ruminococcaceae bacterium]|nr:RNA polymerase sporulation sigma factor SigE [Oscillospiraceae bacterium]